MSSQTVWLADIMCHIQLAIISQGTGTETTPTSSERVSPDPLVSDSIKEVTLAQPEGEESKFQPNKNLIRPKREDTMSQDPLAFLNISGVVATQSGATNLAYSDRTTPAPVTPEFPSANPKERRPKAYDGTSRISALQKTPKSPNGRKESGKPSRQKKSTPVTGPEKAEVKKEIANRKGTDTSSHKRTSTENEDNESSGLPTYTSNAAKSPQGVRATTTPVTHDPRSDVKVTKSLKGHVRLETQTNLLLSQRMTRTQGWDGELLHTEPPELDSETPPRKRAFQWSFPRRLDRPLELIENYEPGNVVNIYMSKLHISLRRLGAMCPNDIPGDSKYHFRTRADDILNKWAGFIWASLVYVPADDGLREQQEVLNMVYGLADGLEEAELLWPITV
ncbi:hypothetical protein B0H34DRAFT_802365 [Crassisporium funariophilum]|nr:hypothetical protein B0H34DRAFT_802365 [Crassisporium funariophilum]